MKHNLMPSKCIVLDPFLKKTLFSLHPIATCNPTYTKCWYIYYYTWQTVNVHINVDFDIVKTITKDNYQER